jgi:hypothetical protein
MPRGICHSSNIAHLHSLLVLFRSELNASLVNICKQNSLNIIHPRIVLRITEDFVSNYKCYKIKCSGKYLDLRKISWTTRNFVTYNGDTVLLGLWNLGGAGGQDTWLECRRREIQGKRVGKLLRRKLEGNNKMETGTWMELVQDRVQRRTLVLSVLELLDSG